jgi:hypothetical protein
MRSAANPPAQPTTKRMNSDNNNAASGRWMGCFFSARSEQSGGGKGQGQGEGRMRREEGGHQTKAQKGGPSTDRRTSEGQGMRNELIQHDRLNRFPRN